MIQNTIRTIASVVLISMSPGALAQIVAVESTWSPAGTYYSFNNTYGWKFTVGETPISVSGLGIFDAGLDGLTDSHQVGIWATDGSVMVQDTVPSGTSATLVGSYRFTLVSPETLDANTTYYIGAHFPTASDTAISFAAPQTYAEEITYLTSSYSLDGFSSPETSFGGSHGVFGPNFQFTAVPEPHEYALLMGLGLAGFFCVRKARANRANDKEQIA